MRSKPEPGATPHVCLSYPRVELPFALKGLAESVRNHPPEVESQGRVFPGWEAFPSVAESVHLIGKVWEPGRTITIGFLDGSPAQRAKVKRWAVEWLDCANLHFAFDAPNPEVRVSFGRGGKGSYSYIGPDCLAVPPGQLTVNFGWVTDTSADVADRAVIVHEFGHMLGLGHEQSSPKADIQWDRAKALAYYEQTQGWSEQMVLDNVFAVFNQADVIETAYDRTSIMQYPVPNELTLDGRGVPWNTDLSPLDRSHVAAMYPGVAVPPPVPPPPPNPPGLGLPGVVIGGPAAKVTIPSPGRPARFRLDVKATGVYDLGVAVDQARGHQPGVVIVPDATGQPLTIGLVHGRGLFQFDTGGYEVQVFNPVAGLTGIAFVKVAPR